MRKVLAFPFRLVEVAVLVAGFALIVLALAVACVGLLYRVLGDLVEGC